MNVAVFIQGFVVLLWIAAVALGVMAFARVGRGQPARGLGRLAAALLVLAVIFTTVSAGLVFINPQERGVVISAVAAKGYREDALQPGLRWVVPFAETVVVYPISRQTYTMSSVASEGQVKGDDSIIARTADGQQVNIESSVIYYINPDKVVQVHIAWQSRYNDDLVRPLVRGIIRDAVSQYGVQEVYSGKRNELSQQITTSLNSRLETNGLKLQEFILRNITFSPEYAKSVEEKQVAQQQAEQAKFVVEQRRQEAEQARQVAQGRADAVVIASKGDAEARLIQAQAESQALEKIAQALKDRPELLNYQYISRLAPNMQVMLLPANTPFVLPFPNYGPTQSGGTLNNGNNTTVMPTPVVPTPTTAPTAEPTATPQP